jgi:putative phage cell wall peptidase, NlpC/P60 family
MTPEAVVAAARPWLGTPYRHRAATRGAGCDCLGLLRGVWRTLYGTEPMAVPAYRADMRDPAHAGALRRAAELLLLAETGPPAAGQVVLFTLGGLAEAKHCGILVAPGPLHPCAGTAGRGGGEPDPRLGAAGERAVPVSAGDAASGAREGHSSVALPHPDLPPNAEAPFLSP